MPLPLVGAQAVLSGMPEFNRNADQVNAKIGGITTKMSGMGGVAQRASGLVSGAFKAMAIGVGGAVAGIGAVGGGLAKLAYDASVLPGIESVFKNMTTSMGVDADALMGKMREASYGAVKDFDLMKSANKAMVGAGGEFGKMFAESLPTLMKVSREAAKAQGLSVEYMYDSIVTGVKRMSPMILDNLGFQFSLTEANEKYAASVGKTANELSKQEKQQALLMAVLDAGNRLIDETGGHVDSVQKDVIAWGTALKNVKDRVGIELVPILQTFMNIIGKPTQGMQDAIVGVAKRFTGWLIPAIEAVSLAISTLLNGPVALLIKGLAGIGAGGLATLGATLSGILTGKEVKFGDFGAVIEKSLTPALGPELAKKIGDSAAKIAEAVQGALGPIRDRVGEIADYIRPRLDMLVMYFGMFAKGVQEALGGGGIQKMLDAVKGSLMALFGIENAQKIIEFGGKFKWLADVIQQNSDLILSVLKGIALYLASREFIGAASSAAKAVSGIFGGMGQGIMGLLSPMSLVSIGVAGFALAWSQNWFGIRDKTAAVIADIQEALPSAGKAVSGFGEMISGMFSGDLIKAGEGSLKLTDGLYGIGTAFGMSNEQAEIFSQTVGDVLSNVVTLAKSIYDTVAPIIQSIGDTLGGLFAGGEGGGFEGFLSGIFDEETVAGIMNVVALLQDMMPQVQELITNVFNTVLEVAIAVWPYVQTIIETVWTAISDVIKVFITDILPVLIAAFTLVLTWINDNWPMIQEIIVAVFTAIAAAITAVVTTVLPWLVETFAGVASWVNDNWPMIAETITNVMNTISAVIQIVWENIQAFWQQYGDNIIAIATSVWEIIRSVIETAIYIIEDVITIVCSIINGDWDKAWNAVLDIAKRIWDLIKVVVENAIKIVLNVIDVTMGLIKLAWSNTWDTIKLIVENIWEGIKRTVDTAINGVKDTISRVMNDIKQAWDNVWKGLGDTVKNVWNDIVGFVCDGVNRVVDLINDMIEAANKVPGVDIPKLGEVQCSGAQLAQGGLLNKPTFVAGEAGTEVVAPLTSLLGMIKSSFVGALSELMYRSTPLLYSGPQPNQVYNYGGDTFNYAYNLTTQSLIKPGTLAMEFTAMELVHA